MTLGLTVIRKLDMSSGNTDNPSREVLKRIALVSPVATPDQTVMKNNSISMTEDIIVIVNDQIKPFNVKVSKFFI